MPTTKKRINISLSPDTERLLSQVAARDNMPEATKAAALLDLALEIEEDTALEYVARSRDTHHTRFVAHADVWK